MLQMAATVLGPSQPGFPHRYCDIISVAASMMGSVAWVLNEGTASDDPIRRSVATRPVSGLSARAARAARGRAWRTRVLVPISPVCGPECIGQVGPDSQRVPSSLPRSGCRMEAFLSCSLSKLKVGPGGPRRLMQPIIPAIDEATVNGR